MSSGKSRGWRAWGARIALAAVAGLIALGVAEVVLRVFDLVPTAPLFTVTQNEFDRVPGIYGPNQRVLEWKDTEFEHMTTIDSLGYRGLEFARARAEGEMRVFFSGDSFTWGHNVADDETMPAQLETFLRRHCGAVTVVNGGLSGSTILEEQAMIERGLTLDPTVVVLMYHENDMGELVHTRLWEALAVNRERKSSPPLSYVYPWLRHAAIWNLAQEVLRWGRIQAGGQGVGPVPDSAPLDTTAARTEYAWRLREVAELLQSRGVPFVFVGFPHPESVRRGQGDADYGWVLETARSMGLPTVDLLPTMTTSGETVEAQYLLPRDYHPSPVGHRVAAEMLGSFLTEDPRYGCVRKEAGSTP